MATLGDVNNAATHYGLACETAKDASRAKGAAREQFEATLLAAWHDGVSEEELIAAHPWARSTLVCAIRTEAHRLDAEQ